jgi:hypothetical protein
MSIPQNRMSYADIYEVFDKALADPLGIRIPFGSNAEAMTYRMRLHTGRAVDRRENAKLYEKGHQMHGQSVYDTLQCVIRQGEDGTHFVYIEPRDKNVSLDEIESLSEIEGETSDATS